MITDDGFTPDSLTIKKITDDDGLKTVWWRTGLLTQGVSGVPQDPLAPHRGPLGSSPDRDSAIGNATTLEPGPLARLYDLQLLTELSPQASPPRWAWSW